MGKITTIANGDGPHRPALVTGATGYIGFHLTQELLSSGREVYAVVRSSSDISRLQALSRPPGFLIYDGSMSGVTRIVEAVRPGAVFHLASTVIVEHKPEQLGELVAANVLFGTQLAEALAGICPEAPFINTGTYLQHYDGDAYNPVNLYAATKQAFEDILLYFRQVRGLRVITLKLFGTYGPGDWRNKILSLLIKNANSAGEVLKVSSGEQVIDLVHVSDVVRAYQAAETLAASGSVAGCFYAIDSGRRVSIRDLVSIFESSTGMKLRVEWGARQRMREILNPWHGERLPSWTAQISLEAGIKDTVEQERAMGLGASHS